MDQSDGGAIDVDARVALVTALGETTGPARDEARETLMAGALVDEPRVHRAMRTALVRIGALTAAEARGLPTLRQALRALRRAVGQERAAAGVCALELRGVGRRGVLELTSQTRFCADGEVLVGEFVYDPGTRRIRVLQAEIEHLR
jgi:hypothetical protein